jgi:hypothetical protein
MSFRGAASWAKMTSPGNKLTTLVCHPTKKVNIAEELTYLSINIAISLPYQHCIKNCLENVASLLDVGQLTN